MLGERLYERGQHREGTVTGERSDGDVGSLVPESEQYGVTLLNCFINVALASWTVTPYCHGVPFGVFGVFVSASSRSNAFPHRSSVVCAAAALNPTDTSTVVYGPTESRYV